MILSDTTMLWYIFMVYFHKHAVLIELSKVKTNLKLITQEMLSGPMQGRVDSPSVKVPLVSAHQVILSSQAHNSLNVDKISTNFVSIFMLVFVPLYDP